MKKQKREEDRISCLPDPILSRILSFLPTKNAVGTTILSRRWEFIWRPTSVLDLDDSVLLHPDKATDQERKTSFINFVNRVLILCDAPYLHSFRLKCSFFEEAYLKAWILAALRHGVEELDLSVTLVPYENDLYSSREKLYFLQTFKMKGDLFYFKGLVNLKLGKHFSLHVCNSVWFPNLKKLHLQGITFDTARTCDYMLRNSPVLEQMVVEKCGMEVFDDLSFSVESDSLKSFTLICATKTEHQFRNEFIEEYDIDFFAKNLQYLRYEDHIRTISDHSHHPDSLVEAYIDVYARSVDVEDTISTIGKDLLLLVSNAQFLHFSGSSLEVFSYTIGINCWPEYTNLTILGLAGNSYCGVLLPIFLKSSPNLQQLFLYEDETLLDAKLNKFKWSPPDEVPECLSGSLRAINIRGFDGQDDMIQLIRYFLRHGTLLNKILVSPKKLTPEELDLCKNSLRDFLES